jgi:hypothetical protein
LLPAKQVTLLLLLLLLPQCVPSPDCAYNVLTLHFSLLLQPNSCIFQAQAFFLVELLLFPLRCPPTLC